MAGAVFVLAAWQTSVAVASFAASVAALVTVALAVLVPVSVAVAVAVAVQVSRDIRAPVVLEDMTNDVRAPELGSGVAGFIGPGEPVITAATLQREMVA